MENNSVKPVEIRRSAMALLSRREHSRRELTTKLKHRGFSSAMIAVELDRLAAEGLLNEYRFAESYLNMRANAGFGPSRIREELKLRGLNSEIIDTVLNESDTIWHHRAKSVVVKRFGQAEALDFEKRIRCSRFLSYRGFSQEHIKSFFVSQSMNSEDRDKILK